MTLDKQRNFNDFEKIHNRRFDCSVNKASNEIMLHRISEGKDIGFPFTSLIKE